MLVRRILITSMQERHYLSCNDLLTGKEKYRKAIDLVYSQIEIMPRCNNEARSFWHKDIYP